MARRNPRRNPKETVLDLLGGDIKHVFDCREVLPNEPGEQFPLNAFSRVTKHDGNRVKHDPSKFVPLSPLLMYSDYTGSSVEMSNVREFLKEFSGIPGVYEVYGGYGTRGVAIRLDVDNEEIVETLKGLEDYPAISDEALGETEMELADEAAESYGYHDFVKAIEEKLDITILDEDKSEKVKAFFWEMTQDLPEPYVVETAASVHFFIDRMVQSIELLDLDEREIEYEEA